MAVVAAVAVLPAWAWWGAGPSDAWSSDAVPEWSGQPSASAPGPQPLPLPLASGRWTWTSVMPWRPIPPWAWPWLSPSAWAQATYRRRTQNRHPTMRPPTRHPRSRRSRQPLSPLLRRRFRPGPGPVRPPLPATRPEPGLPPRPVAARPRPARPRRAGVPRVPTLRPGRPSPEPRWQRVPPRPSSSPHATTRCARGPSPWQRRSRREAPAWRRGRTGRLAPLQPPVRGCPGPSPTTCASGSHLSGCPGPRHCPSPGHR